MPVGNRSHLFIFSFPFQDVAEAKSLDLSDPAVQYAEHQMCRRWRWCGGKDVPADILHHRSFSQRVHPHGVRQLQLAGERGRPDHQPQPVGHSRPGGIRPSAYALLPPDQCLRHLLLHFQPSILRECEAQVAARGEAPLPQRADPSGWHKERPAQ